MVWNVREFKHLKPNQFQRNHLQTFNEKHRFLRKPSLVPYCKEYCDNSSIHCIRYLTDTKMQRFEKIFWFFVIMATSIGAIFIYIELTELYFSQRLQTTVSNSVYPIFFIPFPSIGVCARYRIDWPKLQMAHKRFLPQNSTKETIDTFHRFFESLEDLRFGKFKHLEKLFESREKGRIKRLQLIDNVDIREVMQYLTFSCDEIFDQNKCFWRKQKYNCCDLFKLQRTEIGYCFVFNSGIDEASRQRVQEDKYYPYHNSKAGESSGLEFEILLDETKMRPGYERTNGVYTMGKHPQQWSNDARFINFNTFSKVAITAQLTETDEQTRAVSSDVRKCLFGDERDDPLYKIIPGLPYWRGNCRTRCHQEYLLKYCNCSISLFFPKTTTDNFRECKPTDFECIYTHNEIFNSEHHIFESPFEEDIHEEYSMECNCMNNCNQLIYDSYFTSVPLVGVNASDSIKRVHIDIHYQKDNIIMYSTRMRYTFAELVANFGGIIGLFLGASLLSGVELVYYFTIGLYMRLRQQHKFGYQQQRQFKIVNVQKHKPDATLKTHKYFYEFNKKY